MSDATSQHGHHNDHHDGPHEGPIKTPKQLILAVFWAFVIPIAVIVLLTMYVTSDHRPAAGSDGLGKEAVAARIQPVGRVQVKDASDLSTLKTGEQVFAAQCTTCHTAGLVGAPKLGDEAAWSARIKTGYAALLHSALAGKGQMGAQGGGDFADLEIGRAVVYMANKAGAKFDEPKPPAPGASAPAATVAAAATPAPAAAPAAAAAPAPVAAAEPAKADASAPPALYTQTCQVCHATGVAGAPKVGDKAAWTARLAEAKDIDGVTAIAIKGKGAMPPKGGAMSASDADIKAVVTFMVNASK